MKRLIRHLVLFTLLVAWGSVPSVAAETKPEQPTKTEKAAKDEKATKDDKAAKDEKPAKDDEKSKTKESAKTKESPKAGESPKTEAAKPAEGAESAGAAKHEVKKGPFSIEVELKGVFEARKMTDIVIRPEQWTSFTVLKAVEHGSRVKRGDLLVAVETDKIDQAIADLKTKQRLSDLDIERAKQQLAALEKLTPMDLVAAERSRRIAKEDLAQTLEVELPTARKAVDFSLQMSADSLAYEKEELRQLEKMYKADDLTEETEEIVLRRARDSVRRAEFFHTLAKLRHDEALKFGLPREEEGAKESTQRTTLAADQAKIILPLTLKKQQLDLEKMKIERTRDDETLKELLADRESMVIKAPVDGVVYCGRFVDGEWSATSSEQLQRGASLPAGKVFMTIVEPRPMAVRAETPEKDLQYVHPGLKGSARPTGYPDVRLSAIVADVAAVPSATNTFDTKITIGDEGDSSLMPGMTCTVKMIGYQKKDALTVPPSALKTDPLDDEKHFVRLVDKKGEAKEHPVTVGKRTDKLVEILKGLSEGDQVLREYPKDDDKKVPKDDDKKAPKHDDKKAPKDDDKKAEKK